jgi:hypothetical protein
MRLHPFRRLLTAAAALLVLPLAALCADAGEAARLLPDTVGGARAQGPARRNAPPALEQIRPEDFGFVSAASRAYGLPGGERVGVSLIKTSSASAAYSLFTALSKRPPFDSAPDAVRLQETGTASLASASSLIFAKGAAVAVVEAERGGGALLSDFARALAQTVEAETNEIPSLVLHLPDWETAHARALYAVSPAALVGTVRNQPALEAVSFGAGTEAITADYGAAGRLVVVEYATPQVAVEADARIRQRITELAAAGQSTPSIYRREGNYSIFVFDASDPVVAAQLAGRVKYEKDVRWLGDNPHAFERHNRAWLNLSTSVIVNTVKAAGLAVLLCLTVGGVFGAIIFRRRRAQAALAQSYSDAGGMMRLDLDDHAAKLLGHGEK